MKISISKTKSIAFKGKEPVITKSVINNKPIVQKPTLYISSLSYNQ